MEDSQLTIGQRVSKARNLKKFTQAKLADGLKITPAGLSHIESGKSALTIDNAILIATILRVNINWLLTGDGPIDKNGRELDTKTAQPVQLFTTGKEKHHDLQAIPLYDITASAGLSSLYNSSNNILDYLSIPNLPRCDGAINVKGDSMYPLLKHGDIVVFQRLVDIPDEIMFGEMYVVDMSTPHLERIYVKYVQKSEKGEDYVKLVSYNEKHHPPKDVALKKIRAMAQVKASIRIS